MESILQMTGFFPDPALLLCHSRVPGWAGWKVEAVWGTHLVQWPLKCPAEADKRSQVQWKNSHVITTRGRYGVSHYCQESAPTANSSANTPIALLYGVKCCRNLWVELSFFFFIIWVNLVIFCWWWKLFFVLFCSFSAATKSVKVYDQVITSSC